MKKGFKILLYALLLIYVLTACASKNENHAAASDTTASATDETSVPIQTKTREYPAQQEDAESENTESQKEDMPETAAQNEISQPEEPEDTAVKEDQRISYDFFTEKEWDIPDELTPEDITFFTDFMNSTENNGFLQSEYDTPTDAVLEEVFYNGAGVSTHSLTAEEEAAYEEKVPWGIETDVERLTTEELDRFLLKKTGYSYAEMNSPLKWTYLEQFDAYISDHGDTNWREYRCLGGRIQCDIYEIYYQAVYHQNDDNGGVLTLRKNGGDYLFVSNQWDYIPDLTRLSDPEIRELAFFAENRDVWSRNDHESMVFYYTVWDLDQDGTPELITNETAEIDLKAEHHFYHTDDAFTELEELSQESYDCFYAAMGKEDDSMEWQKTTPTELRTASVKRAFRILTDRYLGNRYRFFYLL